MLRPVLAAALAGLLLAVAPAPARAQTLHLDQLSAPTGGTITITGGGWYGQTFQPGVDGRLVLARLNLTSTGPVQPLTVQVRTVVGGVPTDQVLAEETVASGTAPIDVGFDPAPAVRQDQPHALVVRTPGVSGFWDWSYGTYANGDFAHRLSSPTWSKESASDLAFVTYMLPVPGDTAPPTTAATPATAATPSGWWRAPLGLAVTADDGTGIGVEETRCWLDPATPPATFAAPGRSVCPTSLGDGEHTLHTASMDAFDQAGTPQAHTFRVDGTPPVTTASGIGGEPTAAPQEVTLTASDDGGSGVAAIHYEIGRDPAAPTAASPVYHPAAKPKLLDGERIRYAAVDRVGNVEAETTSRAAQVRPSAEVRTETVPGPARVETRTVPAALTATVAARARDLLGTRGRTFRVTVGCGDARACRVTVAAEVRVGKKLVARLQPKAVRVAAGRTRVVRLTLTKAQRRKLGKSARVRVTVRTEGAAAPSVALG